MSPLDFGDKCFLCGQEIGETAPRQFYRGVSSMVICHTGCLNVMNTNGGKPADYHRAMGAPAAIIPGLEEGTPSYTGPSWLEFSDLGSLQAHGHIPPHVKVTVAGVVVQAGG